MNFIKTSYVTNGSLRVIYMLVYSKCFFDKKVVSINKKDLCM